MINSLDFFILFFLSFFYLLQFPFFISTLNLDFFAFFLLPSFYFKILSATHYFYLSLLLSNSFYYHYRIIFHVSHLTYRLHFLQFLSLNRISNEAFGTMLFRPFLHQKFGKALYRKLRTKYDLMTKTVKNVIGKLIETHEKLYGNYNKMSWTRVETDRNNRQLEDIKIKRWKQKRMLKSPS